MENTILILVLLITLVLLYYFVSPVLFSVGKFILKLLTFKRFPPDNPSNKQISNTVFVGFLFFFIIAAIIFYIKNN